MTACLNLIVYSLIIHAESVNHHLEVNFDLLSSTVRCSFTSPQTRAEKHCIIEYGPELESSCTPPLLYKSESRQNTSHSLIIDLPVTGLSHSQSNRYCYIITASNGTSIMKVEGLFNAGACLSTILNIILCYAYMPVYSIDLYILHVYELQTIKYIIFMCMHVLCGINT